MQHVAAVRGWFQQMTFAALCLTPIASLSLNYCCLIKVLNAQIIYFKKGGFIYSQTIWIAIRVHHFGLDWNTSTSICLAQTFIAPRGWSSLTTVIPLTSRSKFYFIEASFMVPRWYILQTSVIPWLLIQSHKGETIKWILTVNVSTGPKR